MSQAPFSSLAESMFDAGMGKDAILAALRGLERSLLPDIEAAQKLEKRRENERKRRNKYINARSVSESEWFRVREIVFARDGHLCRYCGNEANPRVCDHIVPVSKGGSSEPENLAVSCQKCNASKRDKSLEEWEGYA